MYLEGNVGLSCLWQIVPGAAMMMATDLTWQKTLTMMILFKMFGNTYTVWFDAQDLSQKLSLFLELSASCLAHIRNSGSRTRTSGALTVSTAWCICSKTTFKFPVNCVSGAATEAGRFWRATRPLLTTVSSARSSVCGATQRCWGLREKRLERRCWLQRINLHGLMPCTYEQKLITTCWWGPELPE